MIYGILTFVFQMSSRREANREMTRPMFMENLKLLFPELEDLPHNDTLMRLLARIDVKEIEDANILGRDELIKEMILVSQTKEEIQVMDPKTYKTFELRKPKNISFDSKKIKVAKIEEEIFLIPGNNANDK